MPAELIEQDCPCPGHDRLDQREIAPVEAEREIDEEDFVRGHLHVAVQVHAGRERRVVAVDDTLRISGRPRRERHAHDVIGAHRRCRRSQGIVALDDVVERGQTLATAAQHGDRFQVRQLRSELADHPNVVEALERRRTDERAALGEFQDVLHLADAEVRTDLVRDAAETLEGKEDVRELGPVRQLDRHHVAGADTESREAGSDAIDAALELGVRHPSLAVDDRDAVGVRRGA